MKPTKEGHWTDCINPLNKANHAFFLHLIPTLSDRQNICPVCWYDLLRIEKYHSPLSLTSYLRSKKGVSGSKPKKDSL